MQLVASIRPENVDPEFMPVDYAQYKLRRAVRAIVFDDGRVALIRVGKHGYYMLPGGGVDEDEEAKASLMREVAEELGCTVRIGKLVGAVETYIDRWQQRQIDNCYIVYKIGTAPHAQTEFEREEGHEVIWAGDLEEAIDLLADAHPDNRDGKLVQARDLIFLKRAQRLL